MDVEPAGETSLRVSALPADVESSQAEGFIEDILKLLSENKKIKPATCGKACSITPPATVPSGPGKC